MSCTPPILLPYIDDPELIRLVEADGLLSLSEPRKGVLQSVGKILYVQARGLIVVPIGVKSSKMILCMVLRGNESTQEGPVVTIGWDQLSYAPELGVRLPDDPPSLDADKSGSVGDDDSKSVVDSDESTDRGSEPSEGGPREKLLFVPHLDDPDAAEMIGAGLQCWPPRDATEVGYGKLLYLHERGMIVIRTGNATTGHAEALVIRGVISGSSTTVLSDEFCRAYEVGINLPANAKQRQSRTPDDERF
ncbi:hypothetical protein ACQR36_17335 [Rhodococcus erythropolis]|uniref:hypothetical protein n=1 Tax=Rhodococcus erythropolis TaxID=1833 RepID=UPI001E364299|nr:MULTISPECIES: hypothetical protein [Rhodococcus erythropolis group]MCD2104888.1 hypothetical protein [Rhodococcus qingshengii]MCZ4528340.1 hypothetical protein [Rhodococcus erythropolis]